MRASTSAVLLCAILIASHGVQLCSARDLAEHAAGHRSRKQVNDEDRTRSMGQMKFRDLPPPYGEGSELAPPPEEPEGPEDEPVTRHESEDTAQKRKSTALTLSILLGPIGADRFYLGHTVTAAAKLLTLGGLGIWWMTDIVLIATDKLQDRDGNDLLK